jgi:SAM-dependent methyltransferase
METDRVRRFYDRLGRWQDFQPYEDPALDALVRSGDFEHAHAVFEFGCGTGRVAERLLATRLPSDARYVAIDVSGTMAALAAGRVARFGGRARVARADGLAGTSEPGGAFDRFVCTYVLDLLAETDRAAVIGEAHRLLAPGGRLCLASLTAGATFLSRIVTALWRAAYAVSPVAVGGCRPVELTACVPGACWNISRREIIVRYGVTSEVLVAERR